VSGMRPPVVAGVAGGVGTTTLAVALRAHDAGRAAVETADILASRATLDSLRRAAAVLERPGGAPAGPPAVLAVTLDGARLTRGPVRARLELLEAAVSAVVLLPHVPRWRTLADPLPEVAQLLVEPAELLPRSLRAYVAALRELAAAVAASGRLRGAAGPRGGAAGHDRVSAAVRGRAAVSAAPATGARPPVVGSFRPVVGSVARAAPAVEPPPARGPAEPVRRVRGVRIVPVVPRPHASGERIEQVG
jgi:hypothetical protein